MLKGGGVAEAAGRAAVPGRTQLPEGARGYSLRELTELVSRRTGLLLRDQDREKILRRLHSLGLSAAEYAELLEQRSPAALAEWYELGVQLTTGESYFFRDSGQMTLLKERILPELIERKKKERVLRIWSAGCSTGEEPYSIAILLRELLPAHADWRLTILGSDLNPDAVERGRRGLYSQWSFRMVEPRLQERYFTRRDDRWEIAAEIRSMVSFGRCNLVGDHYPDPSGEIRELDLILCRNVFIYLQPAAVRSVVEKFADALNEGGYLMTGHGELRLQQLRRFATRIVDEQVLFQKESREAGRPAPAPLRSRPLPVRSQPPRRLPQANGPQAPARSLAKPVGVRVDSPAQGRREGGGDLAALLRTIRADLAAGRYDAVLEQGRAALRLAPRNAEAYLLLAGAQACRGDYEEASRNCRRAGEIEPTSPHPYFSLAQIAEARGRHEEAKSLLKKVIYLDPEHIAAYLELAGIYLAEENGALSARMAQAAGRLLRALPPGSPVHPYPEVTAAELLRQVEEMTADLLEDGERL